MKLKLLNALIAVILFLMPNVNFAQAPTLGTAANFVLFTTNGAMTCSGTKYLTHLTGNVGSDLPGSVTGFGNVDGVMHTADLETGLCTPDVVSLYTQLSTATPTGPLASPFGMGDTLVAGVYQSVGAATFTTDLVLNGQGNPNALFIFQIGGVLTTNASSHIKLINGALACNVFWQVGGAVNVGTGTYMRGTIVANGQIDMTSTLDTLEGRALAINAAVLVSQLVAYTPIGCGSPLLIGPIAPAMLDSTAAYGVFSSIGAVTSTPVTYVIGNVGANTTTPTGFNPLNVTGTIHAMDFSTAAAAGDLTNIYNYLVALPADIKLLDPPDFGHGLVLTPHSYQVTGITQLTGDIILNAEGDANAVFVIKINGSLTTGASSKVLLINGTQAKNVYWKVDGAVDIYSNSVFNGTLVVAGAISLETGDTLNGRALTINGAIAINGSYVKITPNACIAPAINGILHACPGSTTALTDTTLGGIWTSSDSTIATIDSNLGIVTGIMPGTAGITYTTLAGCVATANFTVNTMPAAITGLNNVCVGSSITLSDTTSGGTWSSSNILQATVGTSGTVTGISPGTPTIAYTIPSGCAATKTVTVNAISNAGIINGPSSVCMGSFITLTDTVTGGIWSSTNAKATVAGGIVTGVSAGIDTIMYTVTNLCGTATATKTITVNSSVSAGSITGLSSVCVGSFITLTDTVTGGIWSSSNLSATVSGGIVTGVSNGIDTIIFSVTNLCGTATATKAVTVNPLPNSGIITGASFVCAGSSVTLTDLAPGGIWSSNNANATVGTTGIVTGVIAGADTINYTVTTACGTAASTKAVTVDPLPNAGSISGLTNVCVGSSVTLTDGATGGTWNSSNANATVAGGIVTGVSAGSDNINYVVTNICGTATATKAITVNPLPNAGSITGAAGVCVSSSITLTDAITGGTWSSNNATATVGSTGVVSGVTAGTDTIGYSVTNGCGTAIATKSIVVNPLPNAGSISGPSKVCIGSSITLTDAITGGVWSSSNASATAGLTGLITGVTAGTTIIRYAVTNVCGTDTATSTITVNVLPLVPVISTQAPSTACTGTLYQNFGTATPPQSGTTYNWTANNATVWAQGTLHQYALISFTTPGTAYVILNTIISATQCASQNRITVTVGTDFAQTPVVSYFNNHFVCTPANEGSYQWGYDDVHTLDSTILTGEINQDYINASPDYSNKDYWVMTTQGSCLQKTYYHIPTSIQNISNEPGITVYPNPANSIVNVVVSASVNGNVQLDVLNMMGQKISSIQAVDNKATIDVSLLPGGLYLINCYKDGINIAHSRFVKN